MIGHRKRPKVASHDARGATLVEVLVVLMLTTVTASALLTVVTSSARSVDRFAQTDQRVDVAIDALTRDLRSASSVAVAAVDGTTIVGLDIVTNDGTIRWESEKSALNRTVGAITTVMVDGLSEKRPIEFGLHSRDGDSIVATDDAVITACTGRVSVTISDAEDAVLRTWSISLRLFGAERSTC